MYAKWIKERVHMLKDFVVVEVANKREFVLNSVHYNIEYTIFNQN